MRAVAVRKLRDPPELMDLPKPSAGPGELLVRMAAAGVNPFDWKLLDGDAAADLPHVFPLIAGVDGAGTVEAVGTAVDRFRVGDAIFGQFFHAPVGIGTYAEYTTVPQTLGLATVPRGMTAEQAAALPTAGMTALHTLDVLAMAKGQTLLIAGAAGGIGSYATQLAANQGLRVLTISRAPQREYLGKLGAHRFFDGDGSGLIEEVRAAYPEGVDALLDLFDRGAALDRYIALVRAGGHVASTIGAVDKPALAARGLHGHNINLIAKADLLERLGAEFSAGRLRVPLEQTLPLGEGPRVLAASKAGTLRGKAVLTI